MCVYSHHRIVQWKGFLCTAMHFNLNLVVTSLSEHICKHLLRYPWAALKCSQVSVSAEHNGLFQFGWQLLNIQWQWEQAVFQHPLWMHWALPKQWVFFVLFCFFLKCPVSLEITLTFNANIFAGTGELQNRKWLIGLVKVGRESHCNSVRDVVTWPCQTIDLLKLKCTCTTLTNPSAQRHPPTQQKKQKQNKNTPLSQIRNKKPNL